MSEHNDDREREGLPAQALWPAGFAAGAVILLVGLVARSWIVFAIGGAIGIAAGFMWVYGGARLGRRVEDMVGDDGGATAPAGPRFELEPEVPKVSRSQFLTGATLGVSGLIGAAITVPLVGFAIAPAFIDQGDEDVDLGPLSNFPEGSWVIANFKYFNPKPPAYEGNEVVEVPDAVDRRTAYIRNNGFGDDGLPSFTVLSNRCVHLGCPVQPGGNADPDRTVNVETSNGTVILTPTQANNFSCPCHGGSYDLEGNRVAGPPVRALDRYRYLVKDGNLVLSKRFSVGSVEGEGAQARMKAHRVFPPGNHVDGPTEWMYPLTPSS